MRHHRRVLLAAAFAALAAVPVALRLAEREDRRRAALERRLRQDNAFYAAINAARAGVIWRPPQPGSWGSWRTATGEPLPPSDQGTP